MKWNVQKMLYGHPDHSMVGQLCRNVSVSKNVLRYKRQIVISAINCTEPPFPVRNNDLGMYNWTGVDDVDPRPYAAAIKYYCPRDNWGYPSDGTNEKTIFCQKDGTWSNDADIEPCMSK